MNRVFLMVVCSLSLLVPAMPASAQLGGFVSTSVRREYHRETGDFRLSAELYAPGCRQPYWAWISATNEWLKVPQCGRATFSFVLVTDSGKPVKQARWTEDQRKPLSEWQELRYGPNGFELEIDLQNARRGNHTVFFAGSIEGGSKNYTKVWLGLDLTFGGKSKKRPQAEAIQFVVYELVSGRGAVGEQLLANVQEDKGAGGTSLLSPEIVDDEDEDRADDNDRRPAPRDPDHDHDRDHRGRDNGRDRDRDRDNGRDNGAGQRSIRLCFKGFTSWVRVEWDSGRTDYLEVGESTPLRVPDGARSLNLYIIDARGQATGGHRVKYDGRTEAYPASAPEITVTRKAR